MVDVNATLRGYLDENFVHDGRAPRDDEDLIEAGVVDSLGIFMLIGFIHDTFDVEVEPHEVDVEHFQSLAAMTDLVSRKLALR